MHVDDDAVFDDRRAPCAVFDEPVGVVNVGFVHYIIVVVGILQIVGAVGENVLRPIFCVDAFITVGYVSDREFPWNRILFHKT